MALLSERERIIRAREAFALVRQRARKEKNFAFQFRAKQRQGRAQVAECLGRGTFRCFGDETITGSARRRACFLLCPP
jgi:hypothetical protein